MLDMMDTYDHGDFHRHYGKKASYIDSHSVLMSRVSKKVNLTIRTIGGH